jgi:hypothetical protein
LRPPVGRLLKIHGMTMAEAARLMQVPEDEFRRRLEPAKALEFVRRPAQKIRYWDVPDP